MYVGSIVENVRKLLWGGKCTWITMGRGNVWVLLWGEKCTWDYYYGAAGAMHLLYTTWGIEGIAIVFAAEAALSRLRG